MLPFSNISWLFLFCNLVHTCALPFFPFHEIFCNFEWSNNSFFCFLTDRSVILATGRMLDPSQSRGAEMCASSRFLLLVHFVFDQKAHKSINSCALSSVSCLLSSYNILTLK